MFNNSQVVASSLSDAKHGSQPIHSLSLLRSPMNFTKRCEELPSDCPMYVTPLHATQHQFRFVCRRACSATSTPLARGLVYTSQARPDETRQTAVLQNDDNDQTPPRTPTSRIRFGSMLLHLLCLRVQCVPANPLHICPRCTANNPPAPARPPFNSFVCRVSVCPCAPLLDTYLYCAHKIRLPCENNSRETKSISVRICKGMLCC